MAKKCRQKSNVILIRCTAKEQSHSESHVLIVQKAMPVMVLIIKTIISL